MKKIEFVVNGDPFAKQRTQVGVINGVTRVFTPKATTDYEAKVLKAYKEEIKGTGYEENIPFEEDESIFATVIATFGLSGGDYGKKGINKKGKEKLEKMFCTAHKGDCDNIAKIVLDALNGVAYKDDAQIVSLLVMKLWGEKPSVKVCLENFRKVGE